MHVKDHQLSSYFWSNGYTGIFTIEKNMHFMITMHLGSLQNYTGDKLNFTLAAEQEKSEGYKVAVY